MQPTPFPLISPEAFSFFGGGKTGDTSINDLIILNAYRLRGTKKNDFGTYARTPGIRIMLDKERA